MKITTIRRSPLPRSPRLSTASEACCSTLNEFKAFPTLPGILDNPDLTTPAEKPWTPFLSFLVDTVRVVIKVQHLPLSELTAGNPNVKRNGFKFVVRCPQTGGTVQVISRQQRSALILEFSIPKFLTGQNVIGHLKLHWGCMDGIRKALMLLGICPTLRERIAIIRGNYRLTRVDVTAHVDCRTAERADALMVALRNFIPAFGHDVSMYGFDTLYVGQHSKRRTLKIYHKGRELMKKYRAIPAHVYGSRFLTRKAESLVRLELVLRRLELSGLNLASPRNWDKKVAQMLMTRWVDVLTRADGLLPDVQGIEQLSRVMQTKLRGWLFGDAVAFSHGVTRDTYREGRNKVLKATGIDIHIPLSPELQAAFVTTIRDLFKEGFGFRTHEKKWDRLLQAVSPAPHQPSTPVTTSHP
jgi:hypothetical protein